MKLFTKHAANRQWHQLLLIMKMSFVLTCLFLQVHAGVYSQKRISVQADKLPVSQVLAMIEMKTSYRFFYNSDELRKLPPVSLNVTNSNLADVMSLVLASHMRYRVMDDRLVVLGNDIENKQFKRLTGKLTDSKGGPVPGATIVIKGTTKGVASDAEGRFEIEVNNGDVLVISMMGFKKQEIPVAGKDQLDIVLEADVAGLQEVLVVGYGTQKKANLTGAVASVGGEVLESRPLVNLAQGLQGVVPNLNVNMNNGAPGRGATFNIRGAGSITSGNDAPLVLVDGVVMDPNLINPADVQNVTVLKDAGSAAIYGSRAANGVILITTKNPNKHQPMRLSVNSTYSFNRPTYMPKYINSVDYIRMFREADRTGADGGRTSSEPFTAEDSIRAAEYYNNPANTSPVYVDPNNPNKYRYVGNTNWLDELYPGWAPMWDNSFSLSGGSGKISYVASLGYLKQDGLIEAADQRYKRYNASLRLNAEATSWLDLNFKAALNRSDFNTPNATQFAESNVNDFAFISSDLRPIMPVKHPDGNWAGQGSFTNPFAVMAENGRVKENKTDIWLTGGFTVKLLRNLRIVGDLTWNNYGAGRSIHYKAFKEYGVDGRLIGTYPWTNPDRLIRRASNDGYHAINIYSEYFTTFARNHNLKLMAGYNEELKQNLSFSATGRNLLDPTMESLTPNNDPTATSQSVANSISEWAVRGGFFRANYDFKEKYLLQLTGRYDGTSRYARGKRNVFSPSVSAAWRVSEENFFAGAKSWVNDLKLRASYGMLPNQLSDNPYPYITFMPTGTTGYLFGNNPGVIVGAPALVSADFTWEKVTTLNFGLDLTALNDRLTLGFDIYRRKTTDMITAGRLLPAILGTSSPARNSADLMNRGWELAIGWKDKIGSDVRYNVSLVLADNQAEITRYENNPTGNIGDHYVGKKWNEIWGLETDGFFTSNEEAAATDQTQIWAGKWLAGDIRYRDLNGDKKITRGSSTLSDPGDQKIIGNTTPRYTYGVNLGIEYKGFDFTAFFQGVGKRDWMPGGNYFWGFASEWAVPMEYHTNYWRPDNTNAYYPRLRFEGGGNFQAQSKYLQNAAYARLKQLTLGYTLPAEWLRVAKIQRLRVFATGQNLFTITKMHKAFDPELLGADSYPLSRTISFGLQLGL
ncbi:TonB-dependent receptor [Chitinophaga caseinilytica]|uniref:TonB-dependent receptor n=1 Tax=Chitinophaga caseinilytica TaxID=2267521 RepID=A0ABZ2ZBV4_9BACT